MKRRSFLKIAGAAGILPFLDSNINATESSNKEVNSADNMFLDSDKLKYRNQNRSRR